MKNRFVFVLLLAASLAFVACGDREVASSATAPDATLAPSIPTDNTGWSAEPSTAASSTVDTSTMTPPSTTEGTTTEGTVTAGTAPMATDTATDTATSAPATGT